MPFARKTLSQLQADAAADIATLPGADALLRFSNLGILGKVLSGHANDQLGYLDYIAKQAVPFTSTDEYLEAWGALREVYRKGASTASGTLSFPWTAGTIPAAFSIQRSDSTPYTSTADGTVSGSSITVPVTANTPGAAGNATAGTQFTLSATIPGIQSSGTANTAITGGADVESNEDLFTRIMFAYANPPQGGAEADYVEWATDVAGVTRAWCLRNGAGAGTVVVYAMLDSANSAEDGFPQGSNGVASAEPRDTAATGDQLTIANYIYGPTRQPVTALVYVNAPQPNTVNFTIAGISTASTTTKAQIANAIAGVLQLYGSPRGTIDPPVDLSDINSAIAAISGTEGFKITAPTDNIASTTGYLPILGTVTYT